MTTNIENIESDGSTVIELSIGTWNIRVWNTKPMLNENEYQKEHALSKGNTLTEYAAFVIAVALLLAVFGAVAVAVFGTVAVAVFVAVAVAVFAGGKCKECGGKGLCEHDM